MSEIPTLSKSAALRIMKEIEAAAISIAMGHGLTVRAAKGSYGPGYLKVNYTLALVQEVEGMTTTVDPRRHAWPRFLKRHPDCPDVLDKVFNHHGYWYRVTGASLRSPKHPVATVILDGPDKGRGTRFAIWTIKQHFDKGGFHDAVPTAAPEPPAPRVRERRVRI